MTPLQQAQHDFFARRPWVMWWIDLAGVQQDIRFSHEEAARKASRIHNMNDESGNGTWASVVSDPKGERFPRDD